MFQEVFLAENIPCYADVNNGYFDTVEVGIFLDLLRLIDNKRQDIPVSYTHLKCTMGYPCS